MADRKRLFGALQVLGWGFFPLMSCVLLRSRADAFLPVILFLGVLGFSFFLRAVWRWFRQLHAPSMRMGIPLLLPTASGLGALDSSICCHGLFDRLGSSASPEARELDQESSGLLRTSIYVLWIALYYGISYFIQTRNDHLKMVMLESETREGELPLLPRNTLPVNP